MVDESIAALQEDMIPIQESLKQAELNVANHTGRVETLQEQINTAITESTERSQKKAERIANWNEAIAGKRAYIREQNVLINKSDELLEQYDKTDEVLQKLENSKRILVHVLKLFQNVLLHALCHYLRILQLYQLKIRKNWRLLQQNIPMYNNS